MRNDIVWGVKCDNPSCQYVELILDDDGRLTVDIHLGEDDCNKWHLIMQDPSKYDDFKAFMLEEFEFEFDGKDKTKIEEVGNFFNDFIQWQDVHDLYIDYDPDADFKMRSKDEILEYMDEACDRVWLVRKQSMFCNMLDGTESIQADVLGQCLKAIDEVCEKYNIDFQEPVSDWDYGYWSGILAALRWVTGDEKDFLDT